MDIFWNHTFKEREVEEYISFLLFSMLFFIIIRVCVFNLVLVIHHSSLEPFWELILFTTTN